MLAFFLTWLRQHWTNVFKKFVPLVTSRHSILSRIAVVSFLLFDKISWKGEMTQGRERRGIWILNIWIAFFSLLKELQLFFPSRKTFFFHHLWALFSCHVFSSSLLTKCPILIIVLMFQTRMRGVRIRIRWQEKGKGSWWCDRGLLESPIVWLVSIF